MRWHELLTTTCGLQFRDEYSVFTQAGAEVVGISNDQPDALREFAKSQRLNFPLLSDEGGKLRKGLKVKGAVGTSLSNASAVVHKCGYLAVIAPTEAAAIQGMQHRANAQNVQQKAGCAS